MSNSGMCVLNRPDAMQEEQDAYLFFVYCGGSGGGGCVLPLGITGVTYPVRVPKFITKNTRLIFQNPEFAGIRIYSDGGPSGPCANSIGAEVGFYMALSVDGNLTGSEIIEQGVHLIGEGPYEIEFKELKIPQPVNPLWENKIYVHLYWGNTGYINGAGAVPSDTTLKITKHDYEIEQ